MTEPTWKNPPFYEHTLKKLMSMKILNKNSKILVVCGGEGDKVAFRNMEFKNVTISNLDTYLSSDKMFPYQWSFQNAEELTFSDCSFDFCVVHEGLHHCFSPQRGLLEMYRVSKFGLLLIEPCDSVFSRFGIAVNIGQEYEHSAVVYHDFKSGGVANSSVPNYVYRWTEREIVKAICSYSPYGKHRFFFWRRLIMPWRNLENRRSTVIQLLRPLFLLFEMADSVTSRMGNTLAAVVLKPEIPRDVHPWLRISGGEFGPNVDYLTRKFQKE
jgi:ubiquinone/menaquinone biosynthesis C-methylase UbiE